MHGVVVFQYEGMILLMALTAAHRQPQEEYDDRITVEMMAKTLE